MWLKIIYPALSGLVEKIPPKRGKILCNCMIVFMIFNMILSSLALARYTERNTAAPVASGSVVSDTKPSDTAVSGTDASASENGLDAFLDAHFPDERMERIYPNAKITK